MVLCLLATINVNALIVSVNGEGDIDENGMEITLSETTEDPLTGKALMSLDGTLLCSSPLTVTIARSSTGLTDEFCCAGQCQNGNGQTSETLQFTPGSLVTWFVHYTPAANSHETIVYTFTEGAENLTLTVHFNNDAEGLFNTKSNKAKARKTLRKGIVYIEYENQTYHLALAPATDGLPRRPTAVEGETLWPRRRTRHRRGGAAHRQRQWLGAQHLSGLP